MDVLGRALASGDEGFSVPAASLNEVTRHTLVRFDFRWVRGAPTAGFDSDDSAQPLGSELKLVNRELASHLYRRLNDDAAVLSIPPLPAGYDHPLLAAIVCSAPVG